MNARLRTGEGDPPLTQSLRRAGDDLKHRHPVLWRRLTRGIMAVERAAAPLDLVRDFPLSLVTGIRHRAAFADVNAYVMFVGASRSGHSLVGSLLNAHPNVVVAHQLHALRYVAAGFNRLQLFGMILRTDQRYGRRGRISNKGRFHYSVPGQWQGRYTRLRVVGDKRGASSTELLDQRPELLPRLRSVVGVPVRIIHVVRNPFDNISTMSVRFHVDLQEAAERYFDLARATAAIRVETGEGEWLDLRHEDLVTDPESWLPVLCSLIGVDADERYVRDCASIVYRHPHQSRYEQPWTPELIEQVGRRMAELPFFDGYRFDERTPAS
ncbi:MAG: sulfotransferase [Actinobacteria bacterium]|nr:sulfotransferase [Actinomycetota bacterium]